MGRTIKKYESQRSFNSFNDTVTSIYNCENAVSPAPPNRKKVAGYVIHKIGFLHEPSQKNYTRIFPNCSVLIWLYSIIMIIVVFIIIIIPQSCHLQHRFTTIHSLKSESYVSWRYSFLFQNLPSHASRPQSEPCQSWAMISIFTFSILFLFNFLSFLRTPSTSVFSHSASLL